MTFLQRWKVMILKSFLHIHKHYDLWFCLSKSFSIYIFFDFTLCGKTFYREYKVFTHKAYRNSRKIFRCKFSTFIWTRNWSIINYEKGSSKLKSYFKMNIISDLRKIEFRNAIVAFALRVINQNNLMFSKYISMKSNVFKMQSLLITVIFEINVISTYL